MNAAFFFAGMTVLALVQAAAFLIFGSFSFAMAEALLAALFSFVALHFSRGRK